MTITFSFTFAIEPINPSPQPTEATEPEVTTCLPILSEPERRPIWRQLLFALMEADDE